MHCRVLPSPWTIPMPNFASAPSSAISSVGIWPVLENATDCRPVAALNFADPQNEVRQGAVSQSTGSSTPRAFFNSGVVARSGASSTARASQPFGQAMPRLTG